MKSMLLFGLLLLFAVYSVATKIAVRSWDADDAVFEEGDTAPTFSLPDLGGATVDLAQVVAGHDVTLVNFWATWCPPCRIEIHQFEELYAEHAGRGLQILAITAESGDIVRAWIGEGRTVSFPILLDAGRAVSEQYGIEALPTTVVLDRDGLVLDTQQGYDQTFDVRIERWLAQARGDD